MSALQQALQEKIAGQIVFGPDIEEKFLTDFVGSRIGYAEAYIKALNEEDIQNALKTAYLYKVPVVIRGAGTNLVGSTIPEGGIVLDVSGLNRILELDEENLTVTVEPGVRLCDLIAYVESRGYMYAPDPAEKEASIGGNVATNAGGMRAVKYGVTRDFVQELDLIKIDGSKVHLGANTRKNATGLSLHKLVTGSEGTLGVISKVVLKLLPKPEFSLSTILAFNSLSDGIRTVNQIFSQNLDPTAIEFVEKKVIALGEKFLNQEFPLPSAKAYLIVTLDGDKKGVYERLAKLKDVTVAHGLAFDSLDLDDEAVAEHVWTIRGALARAVKAAGVWEPVDTVVPLNQIAAFVDYVDKVSSDLGVRIVAFGHAGDGNVHLCIIKDDIPNEKWPEVLKESMHLIYKKAYALGGLLSAEHGIGKSKRDFYLENADPSERELMLGIKKAFDEFNLLNPHDGYAA